MIDRNKTGARRINVYLLAPMSDTPPAFFKVQRHHIEKIEDEGGCCLFINDNLVFYHPRKPLYLWRLELSVTEEELGRLSLMSYEDGNRFVTFSGISYASPLQRAT